MQESILYNKKKGKEQQSNPFLINKNIEELCNNKHFKLNNNYFYYILRLCK